MYRKLDATGTSRAFLVVLRSLSDVGFAGADHRGSLRVTREGWSCSSVMVGAGGLGYIQDSARHASPRWEVANRGRVRLPQRHWRVLSADRSLETRYRLQEARRSSAEVRRCPAKELHDAQGADRTTRSHAHRWLWMETSRL